MPCRTAGNNINLLKVFNLVLIDLHVGQINSTIPDHGIKGILDSLRLLVDFFHHEMFKAALFSSLSIPLDFCSLLLDLVTVQIIKMSLARCQLCKLKIPDIIYISRIFQDCRDIRSHISLAICNTNDHRTVLTSHPNLARIITEHQLKSIRTADTDHCLRNGIDRTKAVLFIIVINQLNNHLCICLTVKSITVLQQLLFQFCVILNNTVMYTNDLRLHSTGT